MDLRTQQQFILCLPYPRESPMIYYFTTFLQNKIDLRLHIEANKQLTQEYKYFNL